jgi:DNA-binding XRE family transcriptional regulator
VPRFTRDDLFVVRRSTEYPDGASVADRFWRYVTPGDPDACWDWRGATNEKGYGILAVNRRSELAHRVSYVLNVGELSDDLGALHSCDRPPCCNPTHLWAGTDAQNRADCVAKGRTDRGESHPSARLTATAVHEIRRRYAEWASIAELAAAFGVSDQAICDVVGGKSWRHLRGCEEPMRRPPRFGERNPAAKLTDAQVAEVRARFAAGGISQAALAREYGVSFQSIHAMVRGKTRTITERSAA